MVSRKAMMQVRTIRRRLGCAASSCCAPLGESSEDFGLKVRVCRERKSAEAGDGAAAVVCVFLARGTVVQVFSERLLLRGRELTGERSVDEVAHGLMKISLHARASSSCARSAARPR